MDTKVQWRLAQADHSLGFLLDAGTVVGEGTPYPVTAINDHLIPLTPRAREIMEKFLADRELKRKQHA